MADGNTIGKTLNLVWITVMESPLKPHLTTSGTLFERGAGSLTTVRSPAILNSFKCPHCDNTYQTKRQLKSHIYLRHNINRKANPGDPNRKKPN